MPESIVTRMTKGCRAEELERHVNAEVLAQLPKSPSPDTIRSAKYLLQELYHEYRRTNPCQASAFAAVHRCVHQVYIEAFERLDDMARYGAIGFGSGGDATGDPGE